MAEEHLLQTTSKGSSTFRKWVIKPLMITLISLVLIILIGITILLTNQQRFVNIAVNQLNKRIQGELIVKESNISVFKHFPHVSIVLHEAKLFSDKTKAKPPVSEIEKLYVSFDLPDLLEEKYDVRKLSLHGGHLQMIRDSAGNMNIAEALKMKAMPTDTNSQNSALSLTFEKAEFVDVTISFLDQLTKRKTQAKIETLTSSFTLEDNTLVTAMNGNMLLDITSPSDTSFFRHKKFEVGIEASYHTDTKMLHLSVGNIKIQDGSFIVRGSVDLSQSSVELMIKGDKPDLNLIAAFLPGDVKTALQPFQYDGRIYFDAIVSGKIFQDDLPLIELNFGCENAWFLNTSAGKKLDEFGFNGYYTNGAEHSLHTSELHLTNISARPEKGIFKGNFVIHDFTNPQTLIQIRSELELKFIGEFLGIQDLKQTTGRIKLDMDFKELKGIDLPEQSLNKLKEGIESKLVVEDLSFRIPGYPYPVQHMNLHAQMKDGKVTVDSSSLVIGSSDLKIKGTISDVRAFLRDRDKIITVSLDAKSRRVILKEIFAYDTTVSNHITEEMQGFNISLMLKTSVNELLHPAPLPRGTFEMKNLHASFKDYAHTFDNLGATLTVNDTSVLLRNFNGMVDKSDFKFSGRIVNHHLWFDQIKKGKTRIGFDLKSDRFAMADVFGPLSKKYIPRGYRKEEASNVWLRARVELKYDTIFKFAKAEIFNVTADLKKHELKLKDIKGKIRYGARVLILDTLKGMIGKSDFDINLKLYSGPDKNMKKRTNMLVFNSTFLDGDELTTYKLAPTTGPTRAERKQDSINLTKGIVRVDSPIHAKAFNIFTIPFSDFNTTINIGKLKYSKLWLKDIAWRARMQEDHQVFIDTLTMKVANGTFAMSGHLNGTDTAKLIVKSHIKVDQIDLEKIMVKLDHFGQDVVINKNIKGNLTGEIKSTLQVHPNFIPIVSKSNAQLNIKIFNGSLVDFAPMQAISTYFKDKNLRLVRFDTLKNNLTFTNGTLTIPAMHINSSLGFIQLSGKQSVDMDMEYYVRVPMKLVTKAGFNALFAGKADAVDEKQVDEIQYLDKDKKVNFMNLKVAGKPEDFKVSLGKDRKYN